LTIIGHFLLVDVLVIAVVGAKASLGDFERIKDPHSGVFAKGFRF
jgi:hypothetical protein